ncbi:hypothetical protein KKD19_06610 [Patescibacteria group bacterium]|nr:hypothetical protein [Patescibacteria group bacterium]MBU4512874.1 hypothetical protein [Patescibacteria group bacterium]MCG2693151.1 hypothetical protein [Candidatus Parcubacteria bacterium]
MDREERVERERWYKKEGIRLLDLAEHESDPERRAKLKEESDRVFEKARRVQDG